MMEGRVSPHLLALCSGIMDPEFPWSSRRGRRGLSPGCPETPQSALVQRPCYGRENITVSRPPTSDIPVGFLRQPAWNRKPQSQDTGYNLLIPQMMPLYRLKLAEQGVSG